MYMLVLGQGEIVVYVATMTVNVRVPPLHSALLFVSLVGLAALGSGSLSISGRFSWVLERSRGYFRVPGRSSIAISATGTPRFSPRWY